MPICFLRNSYDVPDDKKNASELSYYAYIS
jgi:hypothetical protein